MASSRPIAAGEDYTPDDINNLRNDVLDPVGGHKHNGADGAKVPFSNLDVTGASGSTPPTGGSKSYNDLANHVASSQGQHGLNASVYVAGSNVQATVIQAGSNTLADGSRSVTFPIPFSSPPNVSLTLASPPTWGGGGVHIGDPIVVQNVTATGFQARYFGGDGYLNAAFTWIAIGVKT